MSMTEPKFQPLDLVEKIVGDYDFVGRIVTIFRKLGRNLEPDPDGAWRYVVQNRDGIVMILNDDQIARQASASSQD
jgi:hypothetical protein